MTMINNGVKSYLLFRAFYLLPQPEFKGRLTERKLDALKRMVWVIYKIEYP